MKNVTEIGALIVTRHIYFDTLGQSPRARRREGLAKSGRLCNLVNRVNGQPLAKA